MRDARREIETGPRLRSCICAYAINEDGCHIADLTHVSGTLWRFRIRPRQGSESTCILLDTTDVRLPLIPQLVE